MKLRHYNRALKDEEQMKNNEYLYQQFRSAPGEVRLSCLDVGGTHRGSLYKLSAKFCAKFNFGVELLPRLVKLKAQGNVKKDMYCWVDDVNSYIRT